MYEYVCFVVLIIFCIRIIQVGVSRILGAWGGQSQKVGVDFGGVLGWFKVGGGLRWFFLFLLWKRNRGQRWGDELGFQGIRGQSFGRTLFRVYVGDFVGNFCFVVWFRVFLFILSRRFFFREFLEFQYEKDFFFRWVWGIFQSIFSCCSLCWLSWGLVLKEIVIGGEKVVWGGVFWGGFRILYVGSFLGFVVGF